MIPDHRFLGAAPESGISDVQGDDHGNIYDQKIGGG